MFSSFKTISILAAISLGAMVGPLDTSVNVAFPHIVSDLNQPLEMIRYVVICYVLTYSSLMLVCGKLGDIHGQRQIFLIGLLVSVISFLLISLSWSFESLLFFRFLQGIGTGLTTSVAPAMMIALYPEEKRGYAVGLFTFVFAMGGLLGPIIGGSLVELFGWQAVFWFRIPLAVISFVILIWTGSSARQRKDTTLDKFGAILLISSISTWLLAINQLHSLDEESIWYVYVLPVTASALTYWFIRHEKRAKDPIIQLSIFNNIEFVILNLASCFIYLATFSVILFIPFFLYQIKTLPTNEAGLILAIGFLGASIAGIFGGRLINNLGSRPLGFSGILITAIGLFAISYVNGPDSIPWMILALFIQGFGTGLFQTSYMYSITGMLPPEQRGVSGSITMLTRTIGVVSGVTVLTLIFSWLDGSGYQFQESFKLIFNVVGGGLFVFLLTTLPWPQVWFRKA